jgi:hypothetical protein
MSGIPGPKAQKAMNEVPYTTVRILADLPIQERLMECTRCFNFARELVQLGVVGHQVALCAPCLRTLARYVGR